jgi:hypothetical protein
MSRPETTAMTAIPEIVIEAGRSSAHYWRDLWRYRELAGFLAWRDIKVRYKQAVLGVAWAVIQPAVQTILLTFVFGQLARMPDGGLPYPLIVLTGLLPWQLFTAAFGGAGNSLVGNAHLISKVYFPRLLVPVSGLAVALVDFAVMLCLALPILFFYLGAPGWQILLLPLFVLLALVIASNVGPAWPLRANVFLMGVANGAFSIAAIGSMMALASAGGPGREGVRMGLWGASQAIGFALGGVHGGLVGGGDHHGKPAPALKQAFGL